MAIYNMIHNIKELFPNYVVFIKIGNFYECYNEDANIISFLFGYKLKTMPSDDKNCGFPLVSINKVISNLESRSINYILIDKAHNYEEIEKVNYKRKNKYYELLAKANDYIFKLERINKIRNYLLKDNSKIDEIEKILYAR